ncbi:MAG: hypothetical protein V1816_12005 [Pseudomonadota bacterium]
MKTSVFIADHNDSLPLRRRGSTKAWSAPDRRPASVRPRPAAAKTAGVPESGISRLKIGRNLASLFLPRDTSPENALTATPRPSREEARAWGIIKTILWVALAVIASLGLGQLS